MLSRRRRYVKKKTEEEEEEGKTQSSYLLAVWVKLNADLLRGFG